jgi:hypothetical protein
MASEWHCKHLLTTSSRAGLAAGAALGALSFAKTQLLDSTVKMATQALALKRVVADALFIGKRMKVPLDAS